MKSVFTLMLLTVLSANAQFGSFIYDRPFLAADVVSGGPANNPTNVINGIVWFWLVASDMAVGEVVSNQWNDRIINAHFWMLDPAKQPTNSALGVRFDSPDALTNADHSGVSIPSGVTLGTDPQLVLIIGRPDMVADNEDYFGAGIQRLKFSTTDIWWIGTASGDNDFGPVSPGALFDFEMLDNYTNVIYFTNGIPAKTNSALGSYDVIPFYTLGASSGYYKGYVNEMINWTNLIDYPTYDDIYNLHRYATNVYGP